MAAGASSNGPIPNACPFSIDLLPKFQKSFTNQKDKSAELDLPALCRDTVNGRRTATVPHDVPAFVAKEFALGYLDDINRHLWFAGARRPATQLHWQLAMGREIVVVERMDLHLVWDPFRRLFVKPLPRFLLNSGFWQEYLPCAPGPTTTTTTTTNTTAAAPAATAAATDSRAVALGYIYTYACMLSSESDFHIANAHRLLPRDADDDAVIISWPVWQKLAREICTSYHEDQAHPRFLRGELRLSRINTIHRLTHLPSFDPFLRSWHTYSSLLRDNLAWMASGTIFIALILTAMQVGLATDRLQQDAAFQRASFGFTVFAILGPICALGLVAVASLYNLFRDVPRLAIDWSGRWQRGGVMV